MHTCSLPQTTRTSRFVTSAPRSGWRKPRNSQKSRSSKAAPGIPTADCGQPSGSTCQYRMSPPLAGGVSSRSCRRITRRPTRERCSRSSRVVRNSGRQCRRAAERRETHTGNSHTPDVPPECPSRDLLMPPRVKRIGAPGFEPGTSCSQSRRATELRHAPFTAVSGKR